MRLGQCGWLVHDHQPGTGEGQRRTEQREPAAVDHIDQTAELDGDAQDDDRDVDQSSGGGRLGATHPADPYLASRLDQP